MSRTFSSETGGKAVNSLQENICQKKELKGHLTKCRRGMSVQYCPKSCVELVNRTIVERSQINIYISSGKVALSIHRSLKSMLKYVQGVRTHQ